MGVHCSPWPSGLSPRALARKAMEGSFSEPLTLEEIQEIFWGAGGKPEGAEGDLPWTLFWEG